MFHGVDDNEFFWPQNSGPYASPLHVDYSCTILNVLQSSIANTKNVIVHNLTFICVNKKKEWTLGLDLNKCFDHDIPKCVKNDVLFSQNFDGDVINEKIDTRNVVVLAINFNVATMKLIFVIQIIIRCVLWIIGLFCNFYIEY